MTRSPERVLQQVILLPVQNLEPYLAGFDRRKMDDREAEDEHDEDTHDAESDLTDYG
jgi:hypothetical protein